MKKIADFIVEKRIIILVVVLLIAGMCGILIPKVDINTDMTKYLPDDSSMKIGMDIMDKEFPDAEEDHTIRVMFRRLTDEQKAEMPDRLSQIKYVSNVDYKEGDEDYNKGEYTKYVLHTDYDYGTAEEADIEHTLESDFTQNGMKYKNDSLDNPNMPLWVVITAVSLIMLILIVMSGSWVEPFLFLFTIGIAVVINMGTNIFLGEISDKTFSVASILQLVLSMDYSIILISRYRQELKKNSNKKSAMKAAITGAFSSISSSSITTVVGLLALVFMSFKIGFDMGVVLAKGVFLSVVCAFLVLPGLILLFSKAIEKTAKRSPNIPTGGLAKLCNKVRLPLTLCFIALFVGAYILQKQTLISYSMPTADPIADIFPTKSTVVMVYENQDDGKVTAIAEELEKLDNVKSAANYSNMLAKQHTAAEMVDAIDDLSGVMGGGKKRDIETDESMFNMLYYKYFDGEIGKMTASEFMRFIADDVITNKSFSAYLDDDMSSNADIIKNLSSKDNLEKPLTSAELADLLSMDSEQTDKLFMYYFMQSPEAKTRPITINEFVDFIIYDIAKDQTYAEMFTEETLSQMKILQAITDQDKAKQIKTAAELAEVLGIEENTVKQLITYYYTKQDGYEPDSMNITALVSFINETSKDESLSAYFTPETKAQTEQLAVFTDRESITKEQDATSLGKMLGMDENSVKQLIVMRNGEEAAETISVYDFVDYILTDVMQNAEAASQFDVTALQKLGTLKNIMDMTMSGTALPYADAAKMFGMEEAAMKQLYIMNEANADKLEISMHDMVTFLSAGKNELSSMADAEMLTKIDMLKSIMDASAAGTEFDENSIAALMGFEPDKAHQLLMLYDIIRTDSEYKMSAKGFVEFLTNALLADETMAQNFGDEDKKQLVSFSKIITAVTNDKPYTSKEMSALFGDMTDDMDEDKMSLMYLYHDANADSDKTKTLSVEQLMNYLSDTLIYDDTFKAVLDDEMIADIKQSAADLNDGVKQLKGDNYSRLILSVTIPEEGEETNAFYKLINSKCNDLNGDYHLIGSSAMNYEMGQTFDKELLLITLLTAAAIFLVVLITFRSVGVPAILVLLVQCGVFITITVVGFQGYSINYLALLIVQCILMGSTIDYGILFSNYYREARRTSKRAEALKQAYAGSMHTILTSGLIMVIVTAIFGQCYGEPTVEQICQTLSIGAASAILLIVFILPGILACLDRFTAGRKRLK